MRSNKTEATARWPQWTPGRVLAAAVIVVVSCAAGFVLVVVGSVRATEYVNSPLPTAPGDKLRGAVEFVLGALLVVAGPGIVAILRRTVVLSGSCR